MLSVSNSNRVVLLKHLALPQIIWVACLVLFVLFGGKCFKEVRLSRAYSFNTGAPFLA